MKKLILIISLFFCNHIFCQNTTVESLLNTFFEEYKKSPETAVENLYKNNVWTSRSTDDILNLIKQIASLNEDFVGKYCGYEFIQKKQLNNSLVVLSYMVKYERQPLRFNFKFYKPKDEFIFFSFKFDSNVDDELEEANRIK